MADVSQTHPYTCNSCAVAFRNSDAQRTHMRTDWHRYNLKRKIADLPAVSSDDYNEKVLAAQANTTAAAAQAAYAKSCSICQKTYYSENAYQNHISSQKHKVRALASPRDGSNTAKEPDVEAIPLEAEAEFEKVVAGMKDTTIHEDPLPRRPSAPPPDTDEREEHPLSPVKVAQAIPMSRCLFCNYDSPSLKLSVVHMTKIHGLFVPEQTYLVDGEGLVQYLQAKIHDNHECICCHKLKGSAAAVQTHMRDKGHCRIAFETEEEMIEIGQFYDFSSTYSDDEEEADSDTEMGDRKARGGAKVGAEDEGWETDSDVSSVDSAEITSVPFDDKSETYQRLPLNRHHSSSVEVPHRSADGFHSHAHNHSNAVFYDDHEIHMPSGRVAGHRSLKKYFRQNLHNYPTQAERMARAQKLLEDGSGDDEEMPDAADAAPSSQAVMKRGEAGMIGATIEQKKAVRTSEIRGRTTAQRQQNRYQAKVEKQNNSQKHFRDPLLQ